MSKFQRHHSSSGFFLHIRKASHLYFCHCFFQRGGTLFSCHVSISTLERGGQPCLLLFHGVYFFLLWVFILLILLFCIYLMYVIMGGLDYSIHPCILSFHLFFLGRVFPMRFSLFLRFMRDCIAFCTWVPNMA